MRWMVLAALAVAACSEPVAVAPFGATAPAIDPIRFFTGHNRSWGVLEDRSGSPTSIVETDCVGIADGDTLKMDQVLKVGTEPPVTRHWTMRRAGAGRYEATANDIVGTAVGDASGRAFHWSWTLALSPGNDLKDVAMDQWWYLMDDGTVLNRTTIRKFGIILAEVSEHFAPVR